MPGADFDDSLAEVGRESTGDPAIVVAAASPANDRYRIRYSSSELDAVAGASQLLSLDHQ